MPCAACPGVGQKSAQRMAYHVLERNREGGMRLAGVLAGSGGAHRPLQRCAATSPSSEMCAICASGSRDAGLLCAGGNPGRPLGDRAGHRLPRACISCCRAGCRRWTASARANWAWTNWPRAWRRAKSSELIIATNPTVEGEATAHYLAQLARQFEVKPSPSGAWRADRRRTGIRRPRHPGARLRHRAPTCL